MREALKRVFERAKVFFAYTAILFGGTALLQGVIHNRYFRAEDILIASAICAAGITFFWLRPKRV